jgi:nitroimidazol reductase NimA-like FMN-containing flavoprotein (pyridoxamine 5'-phosphate oxidase superfamily)
MRAGKSGKGHSNMRRKDKEIQDRREIVGILEKAAVCRLGLCSDDVPYVVPLNFGYRDGCLYLHSSKQGRKMDMIRANPRVCFEVDIDTEVITSDQPCEWGMKYASVIGFGTASILETPEEKKRGLDAILAHYSPQPLQPYSEAIFEHTAVIKVQIEEMTGKRSGSA